MDMHRQFNSGSGKMPLDVVVEYKEWFETLPWQVFATFTFPKPVSDGQASELFWRYVNLLERRTRSNVVLVRFGEQSDTIRRHYHVLMTSPAVLDPSVVAAVWRELVGVGKPTETHPGGDSADVRDYDATKGAVSYCLKHSSSEEQPELHRFDLLSGHHPRGTLRHHASRRLARAAKQGSKLG